MKHAMASCTVAPVTARAFVPRLRGDVSHPRAVLAGASEERRSNPVTRVDPYFDRYRVTHLSLSVNFQKIGEIRVGKTSSQL